MFIFTVHSVMGSFACFSELIHAGSMFALLMFELFRQGDVFENTSGTACVLEECFNHYELLTFSLAYELPTGMLFSFPELCWPMSGPGK